MVFMSFDCVYINATKGYEIARRAHDMTQIIALNQIVILNRPGRCQPTAYLTAAAREAAISLNKMKPVPAAFCVTVKRRRILKIVISWQRKGESRAHRKCFKYGCARIKSIVAQRGEQSPHQKHFVRINIGISSRIDKCERKAYTT